MRIARLIAAGAAVVTVGAGLVACAPGGGSDGACTLEILGRDRVNAEEEAAWDAVFADFEEEFDCSVDATWKGTFTEVAANLNASRLAGEQVDLVTTATNNYAMAQAGLLMDLTDVVAPFEDRLSAQGVSDFSLGDHLWSMPFGDQSYSVFFYDKTLFDSLDLTAPTSYDELVDVAAAISATGVTPIVQGGSDTWAWPMWLMATIGQTTGNESVPVLQDVLSGDGSFTDDVWVDALADIKRFADDGLIDSDALDTDSTGAVAAIAQGQAAMTYNGSWTLRSLRDLELPTEFGMFLFPLMDPASDATSVSSGVTEDGIAMTSFIDPANVPMAAQFLEFLTRPENAQRIMDPQSMLSPSVAGVTPIEDPLAEQVAAEIVPATVTWLDWVWPNEVNDAVIQAVQSMLFTDQSPEEAAASMQAALDTLVTQNEYSYDWWNTWTDDQWASVTPTVPEIVVG